MTGESGAEGRQRTWTRYSAGSHAPGSALIGDRLCQVHLSEVNYFSRHDPLSSAAIEATQRIAPMVPQDVPIILETLIDQGQSTIEAEIRRATAALQPMFSGRGLIEPVPTSAPPDSVLHN